MKLSEFVQYDLSGERSNFKRMDVRFSVFTNNQVLYLNEPAYANSIKLYYANSNFEKVESPSLVRGTHYTWEGTYEKNCRDYNAESHARVLYTSWPYRLTEDETAQNGKSYYLFNEYNETYYEDTNLNIGDSLAGKNYFEKLSGNWDAVLVNKIQLLISGSTTNLKNIIAEYQSYKNNLADVYGDGEGPLYSPGLMRTVIERINDLSNERMSSIVAENKAYSSCLEIDLTGKKSENFIKNEQHLVDTTSDKFVIRPINGSFYRYPGDDLKVVFVDPSNTTTKTLSQETGDGAGDYEVIGVNYSKTAMSEPTGGVYEFIALKKAFVGQVFIDYHAFGGEVSVADITNIQNDIVALKDKINNDGLLTTSNIKKSILITNMLDRLDALEHQLEHYRKQTFLYTSGPTDKWVNIAYVSSNPWMDNSPIPDNEVCKLQMEVQQFNQADAPSQTSPTSSKIKTRASLDLEFKFSYEPVRDTESKIVGVLVKTKEVHMSHPTFEDSGLLYFYQRLTPKFRIITNAVAIGETEPKFNNGIMLQMSLTSLTENHCFVSVSDKTAAKSPWTLVDSQNNERYDQSNETQFNNSVWTSGTGITSNVKPVYGNGYAVFRGSIRMVDINTEYDNDAITPNTSESGGTTIGTTILKSDLIPESVNGIRIRVHDRNNNSEIVAESTDLRYIADSAGILKSVEGYISYFMEDMCGIRIRIYIDELSNIKAAIEGYCGTNSAENDRFYLTGIDIF